MLILCFSNIALKVDDFSLNLVSLIGFFVTRIFWKNYFVLDIVYNFLSFQLFKRFRFCF